MRARRLAVIAACAALVLAGCAAEADSETGRAALADADPEGFAACAAYMDAPAEKYSAQIDDDLDLILFSGALAHDRAVNASTEAIAASVNEELTSQGVPSVVAADLIAACKGQGFSVQEGSAAEAAERS